MLWPCTALNRLALKLYKAGETSIRAVFHWSTTIAEKLLSRNEARNGLLATEQKKKTTHRKSQRKKKAKSQSHSFKAVRFHRRRKEVRVESVGDVWSASFVELPAATNSGNSRCNIFSLQNLSGRKF